MVFKKINIKKKRRGVFWADRTLYITFGVSFLVHTGLIFTIPAVDLFSEGLEGTGSDMIVVDFIQEETGEALVEVPRSDEKEFTAPDPEPQPENLLPENDPGDVDIPIPEPAETQFTMLAENFIPEPELEPLQKRSIEQQDSPIEESIPELPKTEKLPIEREELSLPEPERPQEQDSQKPLIALKSDETSQKEYPPEERLSAPRPIQSLEDWQPPLKELPETRLGFGKRPVAEIEPDTDTALSSLFPPASQGMERKRFGLEREEEQDQNRFGIFAGEEIDVPQKKETIQETAGADNESEIPNPDETAEDVALNLDSRIEGPVKGRAIVYQPPPPEVENIENEVEFKLKFWVLPDGTIGEVIPLKRGDTRLERIAIAYLKRWQFEPLPQGVPQQQIWGTIPITFTTQ